MPTRSNYTFEGWFTTYSSGSKINESTTITQSRTIFAHWKAIDTIKPNASVSSTGFVALSQTVTFSMSDNLGVAGYYWGKNVRYENNDYFAVDGSTSLMLTDTVSESGTYYLTVADTNGNLSNTASISFCKTTLDANGGSVGLTSVLTKTGTTFVFPIPTREAHTYKGWSKNSSAVIGVKSVTAERDETYYAVWEENDFTKPTGTITATNKVADSQEVTLTLADDRGVDGYYWGTQSDYDSNLYVPTSDSTITKTVNAAGTYYYAVKDTSGNVSDTLSVTFYRTALDAGNGSVSPASILTKQGDSFTFPKPKRNRYRYLGWNTDSTASAGVTSLTPTGNDTYFAIWQQVADKKPFRWGEDNWAFNNSSYGEQYFKSGTYREQINETYQKVLADHLTPTEFQLVFKDKTGMLDEKWSGSCYGMSAMALLAKAGLLNYSLYQSGAGNLYSFTPPAQNLLTAPSADSNISSLITYYQMLQVKDVIHQQYMTVPSRGNEANIKKLLSLLDDNDAVLVGFKQNNWGGHAVLAYGYEYGSYTKNGQTFNGRILICDPNHSVSDSDSYYIYFNSNTYNWIIPAYATSGVASAKGAVFNYIGADIDEINYGGYLNSDAEAEIETAKN